MLHLHTTTTPLITNNQISIEISQSDYRKLHFPEPKERKLMKFCSLKYLFTCRSTTPRQRWRVDRTFSCQDQATHRGHLQRAKAHLQEWPGSVYHTYGWTDDPNWNRTKQQFHIFPLQEIPRTVSNSSIKQGKLAIGLLSVERGFPYTILETG